MNQVRSFSVYSTGEGSSSAYPSSPTSTMPTSASPGSPHDRSPLTLHYGTNGSGYGNSAKLANGGLSGKKKKRTSASRIGYGAGGSSLGGLGIGSPSERGFGIGSGNPERPHHSHVGNILAQAGGYHRNSGELRDEWRKSLVLDDEGVAHDPEYVHFRTAAPISASRRRSSQAYGSLTNAVDEDGSESSSSSSSILERTSPRIGVGPSTFSSTNQFLTSGPAGRRTSTVSVGKGALGSTPMSGGGSAGAAAAAAVSSGLGGGLTRKTLDGGGGGSMRMTNGVGRNKNRSRSGVDPFSNSLTLTVPGVPAGVTTTALPYTARNPTTGIRSTTLAPPASTLSGRSASSNSSVDGGGSVAGGGAGGLGLDNAQPTIEAPRRTSADFSRSSMAVPGASSGLVTGSSASTYNPFTYVGVKEKEKQEERDRGYAFSGLRSTIGTAAATTKSHHSHGMSRRGSDIPVANGKPATIPSISISESPSADLGVGTGYYPSLPPPVLPKAPRTVLKEERSNDTEGTFEAGCYGLKRGWKAFTLEMRFGVFRAKKKVGRKIGM